MDGLEKQFDEIFVKKSPVQLPENAKKSIVQWGPWIGLVIGIVSILAALSLWHAGHVVNSFVDYANTLSIYTGAAPVVHKLGLFYYLALAALVAQGAIYVLAFPSLRARKKSGWNLLFLGLLVNAAYSILSLFDSYYLGVGHFIGGLLGFVVGAFFLFQIRPYYLGKKANDAPKDAPKAPASPTPTA